LRHLRIASIEAIRQRGLGSPNPDFRFDPELLCALPDKLRAAQAVFSHTGGLHAAALFDGQGNLVVLREDIGRHNAVDKVIGWTLLQGLLPLSRHIMLVSGRGGFEIVQKALSVGIPVLASVSAPSSLAVQFARELGQTLVGFLRGRRFDIWTQESVNERHILKVEPAHGPANGISTCIKGKFGWDYVNSPDRLTKPLIREGDRFREASWDEALTLVAQKFSEIKNAHGPDALAFISSSKCTNEESYLMQKLARAVIGTNNMDNCSRYCQAPATTGLWRTVGYGGDSGSISDIEQAGLVLIIGSNTAESHPVLATRVKRSHKLNGQKLIVADLRENEMARRADIHLHPRPAQIFSGYPRSLVTSSTAAWPKQSFSSNGSMARTHIGRASSLSRSKRPANAAALRSRPSSKWRI
jgi:FdhD/NarQ family/Molybdopterin oxidoreductase